MQNVGGQVGRAVSGDRIVDVNSAEVVVSMKPGADYDDTRAAIDDAVARVSGASAQTTTYSEQKLRDVGAVNSGENLATGDGLGVLTGAGKPLTVRLYGQDLATLQREAARVQRLMNGIDGVTDATVERPSEQPTLRIEVDLDRARRFGVKPGDVRRAEAILLQGILVGSTFKEQKVFDVMVQGDPKLATSQAAVRNLLIDRPDGGHVRLSQVADVRVASTPTVIKREGVSRKLDIEANVSGRSVGDVKAEVERRLADLPLPLEYHARVLDQTLGDEINAGQVARLRARRPDRGLPAAAGGLPQLAAGRDGVPRAAGRARRRPARRAGARQLDLARRARRAHGAARAGGAPGARAHPPPAAPRAGRRARVRRGSRAPRRRRAPRARAREHACPRRRHGAVRVPGARCAGLEILHPMAVVVLCGLVTSTALTLLVLPALYLRFETGRPRPVLEPAAHGVRRRPGARLRVRRRAGREDAGVMTASATPQRTGRRVAAALAVLAAGVSLSACKEVKTADKEHYSPAKISPVKGGADGLLSVTLTQEGADRIEIATGRVARRAGQTVIPYAALLYEKDGSAFVYTNPRGLTYVRAHVEVDRVAGQSVLLREGPAAGTKVVTTGAPQVHGAELEYGEY